MSDPSTALCHFLSWQKIASTSEYHHLLCSTTIPQPSTSVPTENITFKEEKSKYSLIFLLYKKGTKHMFYVGFSLVKYGIFF